MLNYSVEPRLVERLVPAGTELDLFEDRTYVSLVGFLFLRTKVLGVPIPFHRNFEEVNLRFYVKRREHGELRRGVAFVREIVPRYAVAKAARDLFNERYVSLPMSHRIEQANPLRVQYTWASEGAWNSLSLTAGGSPSRPHAGSIEEFITEHYWGYAAQRDGSTVEYRVEHAPWNVSTATEAKFEGAFEALYGADLAATLSGPPDSVLLADGSPVTVYSGRRLRQP